MADSFRYTQRVVLRDLDVFGHVNNAVYPTFLENARMAFFAEVLGARTIDSIRNVIVALGIEYRAPARLGDELAIDVLVPHVGTKSFTFGYAVRSASGDAIADARSTHVVYDHRAGSSLPVPERWRRAFARYMPAGDGPPPRLERS